MIKYFLYALQSDAEKINLGERWQWTSDEEKANAYFVKDNIELELLLKFPLIPQIIHSSSDMPEAEYCVSKISELPEILLKIEPLVRKVNVLEQKKIPYKQDLIHTILAFLWTRGGTSIPVVTHSLSKGYVYPLIEVLLQVNHQTDGENIKSKNQEITGFLGYLEHAGFLKSASIERAHHCPNCHSIHLLLRDGCLECGSPHISCETILHHFKCGFQSAERHFMTEQGHRGEYICPRCHQELTHFGVDYDKPGEVFVCARCSHESSDSQVVGRCLSCHHLFESSDAPKQSIKAYSLSMAGARAVLSPDISLLMTSDALKNSDILPYPEFLRLVERFRFLEDRHLIASLVVTIGLKEQVQETDSERLNDNLDLLLKIGQGLSRSIRKEDAISLHFGHLFVFLIGPGKADKASLIDRVKWQLKALFHEDIYQKLDIKVIHPAKLLGQEET